MMCGVKRLSVLLSIHTSVRPAYLRTNASFHSLSFMMSGTKRTSVRLFLLPSVRASVCLSICLSLTLAPLAE